MDSNPATNSAGLSESTKTASDIPAPTPFETARSTTAAITVASANVNSDQASHLKRALNERLEINADIIFTKLDQYPVMKAKFLKFDEKKIMAALVGNSRYALKPVPGPAKSLEIEPDRTLFISDTSVFYRKADMSFVEPLISADIRSQDYNLSRFSQTNDFPFATRATAEQAVLAKLSELGLADARRMATYTLDYKTLQEMETVRKAALLKTKESIANKPKADPKLLEKLALTFKDAWGTADNRYYLEFFWCLNGLPVYTENIENEKDNTRVDGNKIQAYYSADGLTSLMLPSLYQQTGVLEPSPKIQSLDQMLVTVGKHFDQIITGNTYRIEQALLCYFPVVHTPNPDFFKQTYEMRPAWAFRVTEVNASAGKGDASPKAYRSSMVFDAINGKLLS